MLTPRTRMNTNKVNKPKEAGFKLRPEVEVIGTRSGWWLVLNDIRTAKPETKGPFTKEELTKAIKEIDHD